MNLSGVTQRRQLPLYGAADEFLAEVNYYTGYIISIINELTQEGHRLTLQHFSSLRALKAALVAIVSKEVHPRLAAAAPRPLLILDPQLSQVDRQVAATLAQAAGVVIAGEEQGERDQGVTLVSGSNTVPVQSHLAQVIGELANGNYHLNAKEIMTQQEATRLTDLLVEQRGNGAQILSLGCEAKGLDSYATWEWALPIYSRYADLPIFLEAESCDYLEWVLPQLPGRPLVLCRQKDATQRARLLRLCRQHLAVALLSCQPVVSRRKEAIAEALGALYKEAQEASLTANDCVMEVPTMVVPEAPLVLAETLDTITLLHSEVALPLMIAVSQVSRSRLVHGWTNAYFAACAIDRGVTLLLANPSQREVMGLIQAANELR